METTTFIYSLYLPNSGRSGHGWKGVWLNSRKKILLLCRGIWYFTSHISSLFLPHFIKFIATIRMEKVHGLGPVGNNLASQFDPARLASYWLLWLTMSSIGTLKAHLCKQHLPCKRFPRELDSSSPCCLWQGKGRPLASTH